LLSIFVDADGCPVKEEVYRVAGRYGLTVTLVANKPINAPLKSWIRMQVVPGGFDAADDFIAEKAGPGDIVVTADIPLAARCVPRGARVLGHKGRLFTEESIGEALAVRNLTAELRSAGLVTGGPSAFDRRDRSRFLQALDELIQGIKREQG
jgi:uncharacterized protein YaiI (UPF0178 family)